MTCFVWKIIVRNEQNQKNELKFNRKMIKFKFYNYLFFILLINTKTKYYLSGWYKQRN